MKGAAPASRRGKAGSPPRVARARRADARSGGAGAPPLRIGSCGNYFLRLDFFADFLADFFAAFFADFLAVFFAADFRAAFFAVFFAPLLFAGILALL